MWCVFVWCFKLCVRDSGLAFVLDFELVFDVRCYIILYTILLYIILLYIILLYIYIYITIIIYYIILYSSSLPFSSIFSSSSSHSSPPLHIPLPISPSSFPPLFSSIFQSLILLSPPLSFLLPNPPFLSHPSQSISSIYPSSFKVYVSAFGSTYLYSRLIG